MLVEGADMMALAKKMRMARETQSPRAKEVERGKGASAHVALWGATRASEDREQPGSHLSDCGSQHCQHSVHTLRTQLTVEAAEHVNSTACIPKLYCICASHTLAAPRSALASTRSGTQRSFLAVISVFTFIFCRFFVC